MKRVSIIGIGKLGLCLALNLEKSGYHVIGIDKNKTYVNSLRDGSFDSSEPMVNEFLNGQKNITFSDNVIDALENDIIFIVVSTPSTDEWRYDHTNIDNVVEELLSMGAQSKRKDVVINCTTFPKYCESLHEKTKSKNIHISYNPEFIAQGSIIKDQLNAEHVLIGECDKYSGDLIEGVYRDFMEVEPIFNRMTPTEAEISKISVNCFLTTKISYANMIGDIAIRYGCDQNKILESIGSDRRIGNNYLKYGYGFGGPCFPRDNRALLRCAEDVNINATISRATDEMNELHLNYQLEEFVKNNPINQPVIFDYLTYKKDSVILEESQRLMFALELQKLGYEVIIKDQRSEVREELSKKYNV